MEIQPDKKDHWILLITQCRWNGLGSHGIEPTLDWKHFLKVRFVVAGGGS